MEYRQVSEDEVHKAVDDFLNTQDEIIPDSEFDRLFDSTKKALETVGTFSEATRDGADFLSSRYVDQIPCIGVSVDEDFSKAKILEAAALAQREAHRPYALIFDLYPNYIASLPSAIIGTLP
ncbi:MAG: hypothetical protein MI807_14110 [Verrucomicrobiales bacterium]|nr:hypothetical protein [Verrucomicrobiales bacterium]